ncbi:MAG: response regulator [Bacteroidales bacterium]|nr:response regulator [Bacteroidales bacterium]
MEDILTDEVLLRYVVVDDNESVYKFINCTLQDYGWIHFEQNFSYLSDAICYLRENNKVDVVFLELELPDLFGFEIFEQLKELPHVVVITENRKKYAESICHHIDKGISAFLDKPIDSELLIKLMENFKNKKLKSV